MQRLATIGALFAGIAVLTAVPALAHNKVSSTSPKKGASVGRSTGSASVTFNKPIRSGTIKVTGPGGKVVSVGKGGRDPRKISRLLVELDTPLRAGGYTARWTAKVPDGHTQRGSFTFKVK